MDQLAYDNLQPEFLRMSIQEFREHVVDTIETNPYINFRLMGVDRDQWKQRMRKDGTNTDFIFLTHASHILRRRIRLLPIYLDEGIINILSLFCVFMIQF